MNDSQPHTGTASTYTRRTVLAKSVTSIATIVGLAGCSDSSESPSGPISDSPDLSTPVGTVRAYLQVLKTGDLEATTQYTKDPWQELLIDNDGGEYAAEIESGFNNGAEIAEITVDKKVTTNSDRDAISDIVIVRTVINYPNSVYESKYRVANTAPANSTGSPTWRVEMLIERLPQ